MQNIFFKYLSDFPNLSDKEKWEIINIYQEKELLKNDFLIKQGEVSYDFFFICEGILRLYRKVEDEEITLQFIFPSSFMASISSMMYDKPSKFNVQTLTNSKVLYVNRNIHHKLVVNNASIFSFYEKQILKTYADMQNRLLDFLALNAEQRFQKVFAEQPEIFNLIPLKQIASSLGITPETLSRLRKKQFM